MEDDELFECPVCCDRYTSAGSHVPRVLQCGHTLCTSCVVSLAAGAAFHCPTCRASCAVAGGTAGVPNFALIGMLSVKEKPSHSAAAASGAHAAAAAVVPPPSLATAASPAPAPRAVDPSPTLVAADPDPPPHRPAPAGSRFLTGYDSAILAGAPAGYFYDPLQNVYYLPPGVDANPYAEWLPKKSGSAVGVVFLDVPFSQKDEAKRAVRGAGGAAGFYLCLSPRTHASAGSPLGCAQSQVVRPVWG